VPGQMNVSAFQPASPESVFPFPVSADAQQAKLIRDASGNWFLLGFRSEPPDDPKGTDFVDVHRVEFSPFSISEMLFSVHVSFKPGDTGFASTGTSRDQEDCLSLLPIDGRKRKDPAIQVMSVG
jgi:hypothetical protein